MELLQLHYFRTVARLEHMTKAAQKLQIAQPSLSKTISRLEEDLGAPLFNREHRKIKLNEFGKVFLKRVDRVFLELDEGRKEILALSKQQENKITLAVTIPRVLPDLLQLFLIKNPNVKFQQFLQSTSSMKDQLIEGKIDYCISSVLIEDPHIIWEPLITEEIHLIVPPGHPFSSRDTIKLAEAKNETFINMHTGYGFRNLTDQFCQEAGFEPHIAFEGDDSTVIGDLVKQGLGIAFVPEITLLHQLDKFPHSLRITEPNCLRTIGIAWSKSRYLSETAHQFREFVKEYFKVLATRLNKKHEFH
ncbi:LysR family transcriptional regulator [Cytobacillus praedii]|uniref:LysR family transcriptional regulator n=1 Tax=Cytobacillus praedii TaxID=1742358 RepID=UPI002E227A1E|nr:LysR family transcriptional regulator [Cytobacillus praedii]